jgi:hypothetical protein
VNQANTQGQTIIGLNGEVRRLKEKIRELEGRFDRDPQEPNASIIDIRPTIGNSVRIFISLGENWFLGQVGTENSGYYRG